MINSPYLYRLAEIESGFDPNARNPNSSAKGLFQFINSTGEQYGLDPNTFGTPEYTQQEMVAAGQLEADNKAYLTKVLGREPSPGEQYLAWQQGMGGASKLLANPNELAINIVGEDAVLNNGGRADMTAQQFADKWINKFGNPTAVPEDDGLVDVELPDGTVIEGVPANISKADLIARLGKNGLDTSGLAAPQAEELTPEPSTEVAAAPSQSALMALPEDSVMRRLGAGARTAGQGLTFGALDEVQAAISALPIYALKNLFTDDKVGLGEAYDYGLDAARGELATAREDYPIQSVLTEIAGAIPTGSAAAKVAGSVAPGAVSALSRYAAANPVKAGAGLAAGTGGLYGFAEGEGGVGERLENAGKSALLSLPFGAGGGYVAGKLGNRGAAVANAVDDVADDAGGAVAAATGAAPIAPQSGGSALARLTPDQQARSQALMTAGIAPEQQTAGMITRDPKVWQFEQNTRGIQGVGDELRNRYVQANETIRNALDQVGVKIGGKATTPYEAGESVTEAVVKKNREMQAEVGKLYGKIRDEVGGNPGLRPERLFEAISDASDNAYADNVVNSMIRRLEKFGVIDKGTGTIDDAAQLTVSQAEELRKFANTLRGDRQTEGIVTNIINALDDDVIDTAGTDAFKTARDAARSRFTEFESKILNNITEGRLVSDDVVSRTVFGGKVKDLQALKQTLITGTDDQILRGAEAWNDLKLQSLQRVIDDSTSAGGKLSGSAFSKQLNKIGKERLETVFDPEELLQLRTIEKALEYTTIEVPESVVNYSGTGAAAANNALSGILERSRIGELMQRAAEGGSQIPVVGTMASPALKILKMGGQLKQEAAQAKSIKNVLNPNSALRRLADPSTVRNVGVSGGVYGAEHEPLHITVPRPKDWPKRSTDNEE